MSWEIQGPVSGATDIDALSGAPTEAPADAEHAQVKAVGDALKALLAAGVVGGPVYVRAGGHANQGGGPAEGAAHEMLTLTIDYDAKAASDAKAAKVEDLPDDPSAPSVVPAEGTDVPAQAPASTTDPKA